MTVERLLPRIGHLQLADVPGRNEPGTGEINFDFLLAPHRPRSATRAGSAANTIRWVTRCEGLKWAKPYLS